MSRKTNKKNSRKYSDPEQNGDSSKDFFKKKLTEANEFLKQNPIPKELLRK